MNQTNRTMNAFLRGAAGKPAPAPDATPKPAVSVNGGAGTGAATPSKANMNDAIRAVKYGRSL